MPLEESHSKKTYNSGNEIKEIFRAKEPVKKSNISNPGKKSHMVLYENNKNIKNLIHDKWRKVHDDLSSEIKVRHYSHKTLKAYSQWVRKFGGGIFYL